MQTWADWTPQYWQVMCWLVQLVMLHAPAVDPAWAEHWRAILTGNHFAGEYWQDAHGMTAWWADIVDTLLDLLLPFRADH